MYPGIYVQTKINENKSKVFSLTSVLCRVLASTVWWGSTIGHGSRLITNAYNGRKGYISTETLNSYTALSCTRVNSYLKKKMNRPGWLLALPKRPLYCKKAMARGFILYSTKNRQRVSRLYWVVMRPSSWPLRTPSPSESARHSCSVNLWPLAEKSYQQKKPNFLSNNACTVQCINLTNLYKFGLFDFRLK